jgi:hypothetical protein
MQSNLIFTFALPLTANRVDQFISWMTPLLLNAINTFSVNGNQLTIMINSDTVCDEDVDCFVSEGLLYEDEENGLDNPVQSMDFNGERMMFSIEDLIKQDPNSADRMIAETAWDRAKINSKKFGYPPEQTFKDELAQVITQMSMHTIDPSNINNEVDRIMAQVAHLNLKN